jgi:hypothetical protein
VVDATPWHEPFAELAAGYALDALDPAEKERFASHLRACDRCQEAVADFTEIAAGLAGSRSDLAGQRRRRNLRLILAVAAAAVLICGGVIWAAWPGAGSSSPPTVSCVRTGRCHEVTLARTGSRVIVAKMIVSGRTVWLVPGDLPPNRSGRRIYVLWQLTAGHSPRAVGGFDVRGDRQRPVRVGLLAAGAGRTGAFAVTLEAGRAVPQAPSNPVAAGPVPS